MQELNDKHHQTKGGFFYYLYILYKWKKFILINLFVITILVAGLSFLIPEKFKATARVMVTSTDSYGMGGLGSLVSDNSMASVGAKLFGIANTSEDLIFGILNSRTALTKAIEKFNLMKYYEIDDNNMDKAIKAFYSDLIFEPNDNGLIEISVINKNPNLSAKIANYFVDLADSMNIKLNIEQAHNNRTFIEKRYYQNVRDLKNAEDSLYTFENKYGVFAVPDQLKATVEVAAGIEAELLKQQLAADALKAQLGENSPQYKIVNAQVEQLKLKVQDIKNSSSVSNTSNVLFPFNKIPKMSIEYLRLYRDIEIQTKLMEFILPMYEQAKVEEQKSIPTLLVVDNAVPPQLKYSPKRSFIVIGVFALAFFFMLPFVFTGENFLNRDELNNPLEKNIYNFYNGITRFYKLKIKN